MIALIILTVLVAFGLFLQAQRLDRVSPLDDVGLLLVLVFLIYGVVPAVTLIASGGLASGATATRLLLIQPTPEEGAYLLSIALAYICGIGAVYFFRRSSVQPRDRPPTLIPDHLFRAAVLIWLGGLVATELFVVFGIVPRAGDYIDQYRVIQELPLALRQALRIFNGIVGVSQIIVLVGLLQRLPGSRLLLVGFLVVSFAGFDLEGARSTLVLNLLMLGFAWHIVVRPLSGRQWMPALAAGILVFYLLGIRRDAGSLAVAFRETDVLLGLSELDSLWANAIELIREKRSMTLFVPAAAYWNEFVAFLPSQILPFQKISLADWFVETYYSEYRASGGGWAFGAFAQAVIGYGLVEALSRGVLLGLISLYMLGKVRSANAPWYVLPAYLYVLINSYQSVRDTTFRLVGDVFLILPTAFMLLLLVSRLFLVRR